MKKIGLTICLVFLLIAAFIPSKQAFAVGRNATISSSGTANVGETFTVTLGFSPEATTRSCDFSLTYDNSLIKLTGISNISGMSGITFPTADEVSSFRSPLTVIFLQTGETKSVKSVLRLTFSALQEGQARIQITSASDGEDSNSISSSLPATTVNLVKKEAVPTTTTKATEATTKTATTTSVTTTPVETEPRHPADTTIGKRYDGVALAVPETSPGEEGLPASYVPQEMKWEDKHLLAYVSEPLPWTLYWLADESGSARFYYQDEETSVFVPYYRAEWSARYFTFTVLAEDQVPEGFEVATLKARDVEVPGYRPQEDHYFSKAVYDSLLAGEEVKGEKLPADLFLVACHVNESEEKKLYLFDQDLDSMIRAGLWIVPLAGSVLDPTVDPEPEPTEPLPSEPAGDQNPDRSAKAVNLFGLSVPLAFLVGAGALILILLALILFLFIRARRAAVTPELTLEDLAEEDWAEDPQEEAEDGSARPEVREPEGPLGIGLTQPVVPVDLDLPEEVEVLPEHEEEVEEAVEEEEARVSESEEGWAALEDTLREHEEKRPTGRGPRRRPPGIRPSTHRRPERDDPADSDEL